MAIPDITTPIGRIDLTKLDYNGIINQVRSIIRSNEKYTSKMSSFFEGDAATMLVELMAQIAQLNNLRLDFVVNENTWLNSEQPQTILNWLPIMDYKLRSVRGSVTNLIATPTGLAGNVLPVQLVIPSRTQISAINKDGQDSIAEFLSGPSNYTGDILLQPNTRAYQLSVYAGLTDFFDVQVNKSENFMFKINQENVIDGSVQIFLEDGPGDWVQLVEVDSFITLLLENPMFTIRYDFDGRPTIIFGNRFFGGAFSNVVAGSQNTYKKLRVYYRYLVDDGGDTTNYPPGSIDQTITFDSPTLAEGARIRFVNQLSGTGGADILTVQQVKQFAPLSVRRQNRNVTNEDYEIILAQEPLVKQPLAVTPQEQPSANIPIFYGYIYIAPTRSPIDFIPTTSPVPANQMPGVVTGETASDFEKRFRAALTNFYNLEGLETSAKISSTKTNATFPVVFNVSDTLRVLIDSDDFENDYIEIKLQEDFNKTPEAIVEEINAALPYEAFYIENNRITVESRIVGTGSFIQFLGSDDAILDDNIVLTLQTLGFLKNQYSQGSSASQEVLALTNVLQNKVLGIESTFRPVIVTPFNFAADVYYNRNEDPVLLKEEILNNLYASYGYSGAYLGREISPSRIGSLINDISGINYSVVTGFPDGNPIISGLSELVFLVDRTILDAIPSEYYDQLIDTFRPDIRMIRQR